MRTALKCSDDDLAGLYATNTHGLCVGDLCSVAFDDLPARYPHFRPESWGFYLDRGEKVLVVDRHVPVSVGCESPVILVMARTEIVWVANATLRLLLRSRGKS